MSVSAGKRTYMRAGDRRAHILACARDVFSRRGFHVTSVADICRAAGIGRGTLYQYFGNKRDVFVAVVTELAARIRHVVENRPQVASLRGVADAPPELICAYCENRLRETLEAVFSDEASLRLILREARGLDGAVDELIRAIDAALLDAIVDDLIAARELGVIECPEPKLTALYILGGVEKIVLTALETSEPIDLGKIVSVATRIELFGLLSSRT